MLFSILLFLFVLTSFLLIVVILLQSSKGDGLSGSLGGGFMAQNIVGARQAGNVLQKATIFLATSFGVLAIFISLTIGQGPEAPRSILQEKAAQNNSDLPVLNTGSESQQIPLVPADTTK